MRLIDGNTLKAEFTGNFNGGYYTVAEIKAYIDTAPTVDAVPVVHGRWIQKEASNGFDIQCSVCEMWFYFPWPISSVKFTGHNFCPHCGAKMDGGDAD